MKIGQYLAKIWTSGSGLLFFGPPCTLQSPSQLSLVHLKLLSCRDCKTQMPIGFYKFSVEFLKGCYWGPSWPKFSDSSHLVHGHWNHKCFNPAQTNASMCQELQPWEFMRYFEYGNVTANCSMIELITDHISTGGNEIASIRPSISTLFRTNLPLALIFCTYVDHYCGLQEIETQGQDYRRDKLTSILDRGQLVYVQQWHIMHISALAAIFIKMIAQYSISLYYTRWFIISGPLA